MSHWIILKEMDDGYTVYLKCSNCGLIVVRNLGFIDTCPCCGEKMDDNDSIPFNARWEIDERELGGYDS